MASSEEKLLDALRGETATAARLEAENATLLGDLQAAQRQLAEQTADLGQQLEGVQTVARRLREAHFGLQVAVHDLDAVLDGFGLTPDHRSRLRHVRVVVRRAAELVKGE